MGTVDCEDGKGGVDVGEAGAGGTGSEGGAGLDCKRTASWNWSANSRMAPFNAAVEIVFGTPLIDVNDVILVVDAVADLMRPSVW